MQAQDTSVFSKVVGMVSCEFLERMFSKRELYQAFIGLIKSKPGVELIYDRPKKTWYVGGSWDAICLIRQQMIVLVDCVFTFNDIHQQQQPSAYNQQQQPEPSSVYIEQQRQQDQLENETVQQLQSIICHDQNLTSQISSPTIFQLSSSEGITKFDFKQMLQHFTIPSLSDLEDQLVAFQATDRVFNENEAATSEVSIVPQQTQDCNSSLAERPEPARDPNFTESCGGISTGHLPVQLTFELGDEDDRSKVEQSQTLTSAILDLSRKVDAVTVNETNVVGTSNDSHDTPTLDHPKVTRERMKWRRGMSIENDKNPSSSSSSLLSLPSAQRNNNTCRICSKTFLNKSNMVRHARSIHKVDDPLDQAAHGSSDGVRVRPEGAARRTRGDGKDSAQNRLCKFCLKVFSTRSNLYKHERRCKRAHPCTLCEERFESHGILCRHVFVAHSMFLCRMCDKMADTEESYADHVNFCHPNYSLDVVTPGGQTTTEQNGTTGVQPFVRSGSCTVALGIGGGGAGSGDKQPIRCHRPNPCLKCGKVFSTFSNLLKHVRVIHENARFPCNLCKRVFACKEGLKHHMDKVHNRVTYRCEICTIEFENQLRLAKHLTLIHDRRSAMYNFQCELCGKTFLYKTNLKRHKKLEHEGLRYSCQRCTASFRSKLQLNEHHRIVHLGLPLKCDSCDGQFHTWTTLRDHERAAHGKHAPIVCVVCGKKFTRYPGLSYHLRKHHKRKYNVAGEISANHVIDEKKPQVNRKNKRKESEEKQPAEEQPEVTVGHSLLAPEIDNRVGSTTPGGGGDDRDPTAGNEPSVSSYVPSFYDQQFNLNYDLTPSDRTPPGLSGPFHPLPTFVSAFEPTQDGLPPRTDDPPFRPETQEATIFCLSDSFNFYDSLTLSPDQQQQHQSPLILSGSFGADDFSTYDQRQF